MLVISWLKKIPRCFQGKYLTHPITLIVSLIIGITIGLSSPLLAHWIAPMGEIYLSLLKMCVLPIVLFSITLRIGQLVSQKDTSQYLQKIFFVFVGAGFFCSVVSVVMGNIASPTRGIKPETLTNLGILINEQKIKIAIPFYSQEITTNKSLFDDFFAQLIPDNIFAALANNQTLQVIVFSLIFGLALGLIRKESDQNYPIFDILDNLNSSFKKLMNSLVLLLPFGLCSLIAVQVSDTGFSAIQTMSKFFMVSIFLFLLIYGVVIFILCYQSKCSLYKVIVSLKEPTILALGTRSALASMPSALLVMSEDLDFRRQSSELIMPLTITIGRFGQIAYFTLASVAVAPIYIEKNPFNLGNLTLIILYSMLAGVASAGATGIANLDSLSIIWSPLSIPLEPFRTLLIAIDPLVEPFRTLATLLTGMAVTAVIADKNEKPIRSMSIEDSLELQNDQNSLENLS